LELKIEIVADVIVLANQEFYSVCPKLHSSTSCRVVYEICKKYMSPWNETNKRCYFVVYLHSELIVYQIFWQLCISDCTDLCNPDTWWHNRNRGIVVHSAGCFVFKNQACWNERKRIFIVVVISTAVRYCKEQSESIENNVIKRTIFTRNPEFSQQLDFAFNTLVVCIKNNHKYLPANCYIPTDG
jgi:hypothetical protein